MCGIAGILDTEISSAQLEAKSRQMMQSLFHRGPDEGGIWRSETCNLVLAHRRLSIQDLSANGAQPMLSSSNRYSVVFNGEIYNFREISTLLAKCGYRFVGHSDTEVLLAAIEEWGVIEAVRRFTGMFAFALWDREEQLIHLCRDRLGEKPLYYGWIDNAFYFASELKAISQVVDGGRLEIDRQGLAFFLKYGYIPAPYSIFCQIHKLMPGTVLTVSAASGKKVSQFSPWPDASSQSPVSYWDALDTANRGLSCLITDEREAIDELDRTLHESVRRQLIADVKVGTFLSGGIDSTVVSAIAQNVSTANVRTYTIGFSEREYDESVYAERIAKHLGTDHLTMQVGSDDVLNVVPGLPSIYDEPFADSSQIPTYLVSKLAREHVTVCLSGDGGDELFAGYNRYHWTDALWKRLSPVPAPVRRLMGRALAFPAPGLWDRSYQALSRFRSSRFEKQKLVGLKIQKLAGLMQQQDIFQAYDYLMSYWHDPEALMTLAPAGSAYLPNTACPDSESFIDRVMYLDQIGYLPGDNLAKVDRASMAVSLETRLPLLSHEVVGLAWRIPAAMKVRNGQSKWPLRQVLHRYVPPEMIDRPKMGFSVPVAKWLREDLYEWAQDLIASLDTENDAMLNKRTVIRAMTEHLSEKRDHSHRLWTVLMYLAWLQNHRHSS